MIEQEFEKASPFGVGCSTRLLTRFPYDGNGGEWGKEQLNRLREEVAEIPKKLDHFYNPTAYLAVVNSSQAEAKKILQDAGFRTLAVQMSCHQTTEKTLAEWKTGKKHQKETLFLMGKGFFVKPRRMKNVL